jgi:hypothetical protein
VTTATPMKHDEKGRFRLIPSDPCTLRLRRIGLASRVAIYTVAKFNTFSPDDTLAPNADKVFIVLDTMIRDARPILRALANVTSKSRSSRGRGARNSSVQDVDGRVVVRVQRHPA